MATTCGSSCRMFCKGIFCNDCRWTRWQICNVAYVAAFWLKLKYLSSGNVDMIGLCYSFAFFIFDTICANSVIIFNICVHVMASSRVTSTIFGLITLNISNIPDKVMFPWQMLEVIWLEGHTLAQEDAFISRDNHLLQVMPLTHV